MVNNDGTLKPDHPLIERLGLSMPTCEPVVIFELRRLDVLLEDLYDLRRAQELIETGSDETSQESTETESDETSEESN